MTASSGDETRRKMSEAQRRQGGDGMTSGERHAWKQLDGCPSSNRHVVAAAVLLAESGCTIRRWRASLTGVASTRSSKWEIECPRPTTLRAFAVLAHEVGHQMLHRGNSLPRWLEEVQAHEFAIAATDRLLGPEDAAVVQAEAVTSVAYSFGKAIRRGLEVSALYANDEARWWAQELDVREWRPDGRPRKEAMA